MEFMDRCLVPAVVAGLIAWHAVHGAPPLVQAQQRQRIPAAPRDAAVPFVSGETLTYDVSWSSTVVAGTAMTSVHEKRASGDSFAYYIVAEGRPIPFLARLYNVYYKMDTLLDSVTLLSHRGTLQSEEGAGRRVATTRLDQKARRAFFELQGDAVVQTEFALPPQAHDGLSALFALRARPLRLGERFTLPVTDGGALYTVGISVGRSERVSVAAGTYDAARLTITIRDDQEQDVWKDIAVWMTTGARRLPVKLQAELPVGEFVLALREAR
jgi:hypothetical protein